MLSHHDREALNRIEQWFEATEPVLAEALRTGRMSRRRMRRNLVTILDAGAVVLLLLGMVTGSVALVLPGLCMLLAAIGVHLEGMFRSQGSPS